jgi:predicted SAM-dependent methyltransferase
VALGTRAKDAARRLSTPLRRSYYCRGWGASVIPRIPGAIRRPLGLDDRAAVGSRRIEIGSGHFPSPGYIHVDVNPRSRHLEALAPAWKLPFPSAWADEILAIHSLEHIHPRRLAPTLREWHRVLASGGHVRVHVPNAPELMRSFLDSPVEGKWRVMGALLGMYCTPGVQRAEDLEVPADHQLMLDFELLSWALESAGFEDVVDLTSDVRDSHTESWKDVVPHFSLVAQATKR